MYSCETMKEHLYLFRDCAVENCYDSSPVEAALFHDIGKFFTKSFINKKGVETGVAHYYNHENWRAYLYMTFSEFWDWGWGKNDARELTLWTITFHMEPFKKSKIFDKLNFGLQERIWEFNKIDKFCRKTSGRI